MEGASAAARLRSREVQHLRRGERGRPLADRGQVLLLGTLGGGEQLLEGAAQQCGRHGSSTRIIAPRELTERVRRREREGHSRRRPSKFSHRPSRDRAEQAPDEATYPATVEQVRGILRAIRKVEPGQDDDFELISNDSLVTQFRGLTENLRIGSAVISSIALLAAGVRIMNIMLVSVTERTKEIGIRRAIGAKKRSIMAQFLCEAVVLSEIGGILGVGLGILSGNVISLLLQVPPIIPFDWAAIGLVVCSLVGIVFGTYPAWKAANLDPIESLRYE